MDINAALNVYDAFALWKNRKPGQEDKFRSEHPAAWDIVMSMIKEV